MITFKYITRGETPEWLFEQALQEPALKKNLRPHDTQRVVALILHNEEIVGFFTPRVIGQYNRIICLYIIPEFRSMGFGTAAIQLFLHNEPSKAKILENNATAQRAFTKAGFYKTEDIRGSSAVWVKD